MSTTSMDAIASLAKRRGFIFPDSEIYGGFANTWDYGPLGVELKNNIKRAWWKQFVTSRSDMLGLDAAILMNPKVWQASGHLENFTDLLVECKSCHKRFRADHILELSQKEPGHNTEVSVKNEVIRCPECGGELTDTRTFNLMFKTYVGPLEDAGAVAYLRPELAAGMFTNFTNVTQSMRQRLPFGLAQMGRAFRNEITTGNFIFRTREFEIMEFEYFVHPNKWEEAFEMWLAEIRLWWKNVIGVDDSHLYFHEIPDGDRAHYSKRTVDIEYHYPFGLKELHGIAYRTDFDLKRHQEASGQDLRYLDPETGEKILPHVVEPTFGVDRAVLVTLLEAYTEIEPRSGSEEAKDKHEKEVVLRLPKKLAPFSATVLPLSKKEPLSTRAKEITQTLRRRWTVGYDDAASIGRRYRRQDEIGTPFCVTVDFTTMEDNMVTVRNRDTMNQDRVAIAELEIYIADQLER